MAATPPPVESAVEAVAGSYCRTEARWDLTQQRAATSDNVSVNQFRTGDQFSHTGKIWLKTSDEAA